MRSSYTVRCGGLDRSPAIFQSYSAARSYALGVANREDVQCAIVDEFGNGEIVVRTGPVDLLRREYDPYRGQPFFHPNPEHPRSRERFLRNEPEAWTPGSGSAQTSIRPKEFFGMNGRYQVVCEGFLTFAPVLFESRSDAVRWARLEARRYGTTCRVIDADPGTVVARFGEAEGAQNTLVSLAPPLMLFGLVWFLSSRGSGLSDDPDVERTHRTEEPEQRQLRTNGKPRREGGHRSIARKLYGSAVLSAQAAASMRKLAMSTRDREIAARASELQILSRKLLDQASSHDGEFVRRKLS